MSTTGLWDAAAVLEDQAAGRTPDRARVLAGALALDSLCQAGSADRDILDAAAGLRMLAEARTFDLDAEGRARAGRLAEAVRKAARAIGILW